MAGVKSTNIKATQDEHVFITAEFEDRPTVSLDLCVAHGRRYLGVRVNGMTVSSLLLDVEELPTMPDQIAFIRFCPYCGEEINIISSKSHHCKNEN